MRKCFISIDISHDSFCIEIFKFQEQNEGSIGLTTMGSMISSYSNSFEAVFRDSSAF